MPSLFEALIQQESRGRPGVIGPQTKYGRALGLTQMLPATAQEMARKLGVPWNPNLMTDRSPAGADYQRRLGEAYFQEGLDKTGNERDALRYYHGGPNRALWGPKTNAYADQVLARVNGAEPMPQKPQKTLGSLFDPAQGMEQDFAAPSQMGAPQTLGSLVGSPDITPGKPKFFSKDGAAPYLFAALADGLQMWATGGQQQGRAVSNIMDMKQGEQENQMRQAQWQAQLESKRAERMNPKPTQTDRYIAEILDPRTDPKRAAILRQVVMNPMGIPINGPNGSQTTNYYYPDQMPSGEDEWEYSN